ncbi:MAG: 4-hydroxy-tetrahydrodipicolinate reductase [Candidatus Omnitrophota bacterium]
MIKLAVNGAYGKMGKRIIFFAQADSETKVILGLEKTGIAEIGSFIDGIKITDDLNQVNNVDLIIDFTQPAATINLLKTALKYKKPVVIGTTGLNPDEIAQIKTAAAKIPIVFSPNMSKGVNLLFRLVKETAVKLTGYSIKIKEAHHIHKKDSPSGTAKKIAQIISQKIKTEIKDSDIEAIRKGEIIGDHEIKFESDLDTIVLSHSAKTRDIFAKGAIDAAKWLIKRPAGLYNMQDVIG